MDKWDKRFMELATTVASWSRDPSTKVGSVIVDSKKRIVGVGYNGLPRGAEDNDRIEKRPEKYEYVIHAEINSLLNTTVDPEGCTLYATLVPCKQCIGAMAQKGISRVVFMPPNEEQGKRWNMNESIDYLIEVGIVWSVFEEE